MAVKAAATSVEVVALVALRAGEPVEAEAHQDPHAPEGLIDMS
jgi:hypothetical protein